MITVRIWFTKTGEASYISLLDLQRVMGRALKRSHLPVWYTLGFNPHIYMTFACPLPLGQESLVECVDVKTEEEAPDFAAWTQTLNGVMPSGIQVLRTEPAQMKAARIAWARYTIRCHGAESAAALDAYNGLESAPVQKKSKRGLKTIDLKETVARIEYRMEEDDAVFELLLPAGEGFNLNPGLLMDFIRESCGLQSHPSILRTALLTEEQQDFC